MRLEGALAEQAFLRPACFSVSDQELPARLEGKAKESSTKQKCPCVYLGKKLANGKYAPDPADWVTDIWKTHERVRFEWQLVSKGEDQHRHRACVDIYNLLRNNRMVPRHTLRLNEMDPT